MLFSLLFLSDLFALPLSYFIPISSPISLSFSLPTLGCSQLVLETYNVPELTAGVNCTFEDLSEMDGLVIGNQIQCYSPAAKEVPRIITENGERSPEVKLGGESFLLLPGPRELRTDAGGRSGGGAHRRRGLEERVYLGGDAPGRGGWSVSPLPLELKPGEHPGVGLTMGEGQCHEGKGGNSQHSIGVCQLRDLAAAWEGWHGQAREEGWGAGVIWLLTSCLHCRVSDPDCCPLHP